MVVWLRAGEVEERSSSTSAALLLALIALSEGLVSTQTYDLG